MFRTYLTTAIRNIIKFKIGSSINIIGLSIALLTMMTIFNWVQHEFSYDEIHSDSDKIYRVVKGENENSIVTISPAIKTQILVNIPEIQNCVRLFKSSVLGGKTKVSNNEKVFTNNEIVYTDENFFDIFSFPLIKGDTHTAFNKPNSAVITEETALKYFGDQDPIGQTLLVSNEKSLEITGILKSIPSNSHIHFDILVSMKSHPFGDISKTSVGSGYIYYTYIKIFDKIEPSAIIKNIDEQIAGLDLSFAWHPKFRLQELKDIHLYSNGEREFENNSSVTLVYVFISIGILVLLIASINYINMTAAYSFRRSKEIGIRKTIGADRKQIIIGFLIESVFTVAISFVLALLLNEFVKPLVSSITGIGINVLETKQWIKESFVFIILLGLLIGFFPALFLSKVAPTSLIKTGANSSPNRIDFNNILLTVQFCISIFLILGTVVIYNQMDYLQNKNLGYNKEQVLVLHTGFKDFENKTELLKQRLLQNPKISQVSSLSQIPSDITTGEGVNLPDGKRIEVTFVSVDKDFFETVSVNIVEGADIIKQVVIDPNINSRNLKNRFVVNKAFLFKVGVDSKDAINQNIVLRHGNMEPGPIIGVIDDFHFRSLHNPITPLVLEFDPRSYQHLLVKLNSDNIQETMKSIENEWGTIAQDLPFEYQFLDDAYNSLYKAESKVGSLILAFSVISILIGSIGLFGLSLFYAERKTKEIGIRKVIGASLISLVIILTKQFSKWIVIAIIISWPIGYYIMNKWLENFAYRIELSIWPFIFSGLIALIITLSIAGWQAIIAASTNPVESLRNE